ncbi:hypothetical protein FRC08_010521 [Ceratobasidium sp. 394]|nr:hypothetical protein FRC08_010521 [Ceratobasidium sp. 394]
MQSYAAVEPKQHMDPIICRIAAWFHDKCTFHANDHWMLIWALTLGSQEPVKKGEGPSLMVSNLISAECGFMASPDGEDCVRELFSAGKNREGYFNASHICKQIAHAADILAEHYSGEDHIFIFDNSPTHVKRGAGAPSAYGMPKFTPKSTSNNFLVKTTDENGNKVKVPMTGGYLSNGEPQSFYWPGGTPSRRLV